MRRLRRAVTHLSYGARVDQVALQIRDDCESLEQAHLTAKAAEVYVRLLKRDVAREKRRELGRRSVRWL